ncbi:MAG TPA: hypothetical protein VK027_03300 [Chitinophagaceae bacterium]|nr:hypothetical protein [Chitinophagaceae bacterium]
MRDFRTFVLFFLFFSFLVMEGYAKNEFEIISKPYFESNALKINLINFNEFENEALFIKVYFLSEDKEILLSKDSTIVKSSNEVITLTLLKTQYFIDTLWEVFPYEDIIVKVFNIDNQMVKESVFPAESIFLWSKLDNEIKTNLKRIIKKYPEFSFSDKEIKLLEKSLKYNGAIKENAKNRTIEVYDKNNHLISIYKKEELLKPHILSTSSPYNNSMIAELLSPMPSIKSMFKNSSKEKREKRINILNSNYYDSFNDLSDSSIMGSYNYSDLSGDIEFELWDVLFNLNFYMTSQDFNRNPKSRYFNINYDRNKLNEKYLEVVSSYRDIYHQRKSKSNQLIGQLEKKIDRESSGIENMEKELTFKVKDSLSFVGNYDSLTNEVKMFQDSINDLKQKYNKALVQLNQLKEVAAYDSIKYVEEMLAHLSSKDFQSLMDSPEKNFSGEFKKHAPKKWNISNFDLGHSMVSKSGNGQSGAYLKGGQLGIENPFGKLSLFLGNSENFDYYSKEKRQSLIGMDFESKKIFNSQFFLSYLYSRNDYKLLPKLFEKDITSELPQTSNILRDMHILGLGFNTNIYKVLQFNFELQNNLNKFEQNIPVSESILDKSMFTSEILLNIPKTNIDFGVKFERNGRDFENVLLPVQKRGTTIIEGFIEGVFLRSFLRSKFQVFHLIQNNINESKYLKWGMDVQTQFKRLPNLSASYQPFSTIVLSDSMIINSNREMIGEVTKINMSYQYRYLNNYWIGVLSFVSNKSSYLENSFSSKQFFIHARYLKKKNEYYITGQVGNQEGSINYGNNRSGLHTNLQLGSKLNLNTKINAVSGLQFGEQPNYGNFFGVTLGGNCFLFKESLIINFLSQINFYEHGGLNSLPYQYRINLSLNYKIGYF